VCATGKEQACTPKLKVSETIAMVCGVEGAITDGVDDGAADNCAVSSKRVEVIHVLALGDSETNSDRHL
jgi:hypothetical protein